MLFWGAKFNPNSQPRHGIICIKLPNLQLLFVIPLFLWHYSCDIIPLFLWRYSLIPVTLFPYSCDVIPLFLWRYSLIPVTVWKLLFSEKLLKFSYEVLRRKLENGVSPIYSDGELIP